MLSDTQLRLEQAYHRWKAGLELGNENSSLLGPPLLLNVREEFDKAECRVLVVGQETFGWQWTRQLRESYPDYPDDWPLREDIKTWADFVKHPDAVNALCWAYEQFAFGSRQPQTYRSPFWSAFREIGAWPDTGLMWTNLVRSDYQNGSILAAPPDVQEFLRAQECDLLLQEIAILKPHVCIFFTGPNYDHLIDAKWPGCRMTPVSDRSERELARISHETLPVRSYRLYHPAYLRRSRKWAFIELLRAQVLAKTH